MRNAGFSFRIFLFGAPRKEIMKEAAANSMRSCNCQLKTLQVINQNVYIFALQLHIKWRKIPSQGEEKSQQHLWLSVSFRSSVARETSGKRFMFADVQAQQHTSLSSWVAECITFYVLNTIIKMQFENFFFLITGNYTRHRICNAACLSRYHLEL